MIDKLYLNALDDLIRCNIFYRIQYSNNLNIIICKNTLIFNFKPDNNKLFWEETFIKK